jgi:hypothetical protein
VLRARLAELFSEHFGPESPTASPDPHRWD